jgi:hypothetical protein
MIYTAMCIMFWMRAYPLLARSCINHRCINSYYIADRWESVVEKSIQCTIPSGLKAGLGWVAAEKIPWASIGGLEDVKRKLLRAIDWPLRERESCGPGNERRKKEFYLSSSHHYDSIQ